jgi:hypothetical protein
MSLEYFLAELMQRAATSDRESSLKRALEQYEKFLGRLDEYELLSGGDKKLFEQYMANPSSWTLAPANDAAARREIKVTRFREEKELKQKLEVCFQSSILNSECLAYLFNFQSTSPATKRDCKATMTTPGLSTSPRSSSIHTRHFKL